MKEEMDAKGVHFPPESAFPFSFLLMHVLFSICTLTWRVNNYVSCQGKGLKRRNESTKGHNNYTDGINQYLFFQKIDYSIFPTGFKK